MLKEILFLLRYLVCIVDGHRYHEQGYCTNSGSFDPPEYDVDVECRRCEFGFDPFDTEDIAAKRDDWVWRVRFLIKWYVDEYNYRRMLNE